MPAKGEFFARLGAELPASLPAAERDTICYADMAELVAVQTKVLEDVAELLAQLDLEKRQSEKKRA